jgi:hypothetical protein
MEFGNQEKGAPIWKCGLLVDAKGAKRPLDGLELDSPAVDYKGHPSEEFLETIHNS